MRRVGVGSEVHLLYGYFCIIESRNINAVRAENKLSAAERKFTRYIAPACKRYHCYFFTADFEKRNVGTFGTVCAVGVDKGNFGFETACFRPVDEIVRFQKPDVVRLLHTRQHHSVNRPAVIVEFENFRVAAVFLFGSEI